MKQMLLSNIIKAINAIEGSMMLLDVSDKESQKEFDRLLHIKVQLHGVRNMFDESIDQ